jgi:hypothetical protein
MPEIGRDVYIDASDPSGLRERSPYVSKGGRERALEEYSDADASWGLYKIHLAACFRTGFPLAWEVATGRTKSPPLRSR